MHWLSPHNRSEFLAYPQLVRFDYAQRSGGFEPTLLIKGSTLLSKYVILGVPMQLSFTLCDDRLLYALRIRDDNADDGILWSIAERQEELNGIGGLARGEPLTAFLFNEIAVNVAWNDWPAQPASKRLASWAEHSKIGHVDYIAFQALAKPLLNQLHGPANDNGDWIVLEIGGKRDWKPIHNRFITANASSSLIDLFNPDEGNQQEQIGVWLTDNLQPAGAYYNPQIPKGNGTRELIDILLSHQFGAILIESKTLSILARTRRPDRAKLKRDISAHIEKVFKQLRGAIRELKRGTKVISPDENELSIEREKPFHAIVLIPDLDLIDHPAEYGRDFIKQFVNDTGSFAHILDISELLRVVQAAETIAARGKITTLMMAFDSYLVQRAEKAKEAGTLCIEVLLRFADDDQEFS